MMDRYPFTLIRVALHERQLHLLKRKPETPDFHVAKTYPIAIGFYDGPGGGPDYRTPPGYYTVLRRAKNPDWQMPNSPWVPEELRGVVVPGGDPRNPIVSRWIQVSGDGVGIHGTAARDSIGTPASHGCIRMLEEDVVELYSQVPLGCTVHIV